MRSRNEISPTVLFAFTLHVEFGAVSKPEGWTVTGWGKLPPQPQNALSREEHSSCWYLVHTWELNICLASPWVSPKCIIWDFCHTFVATNTHTHWCRNRILAFACWSEWWREERQSCVVLLFTCCRGRTWCPALVLGSGTCWPCVCCGSAPYCSHGGKFPVALRNFVGNLLEK